MIDNVSPHRIPALNSSTSISVSGIAKQTGTYFLITKSVEMRRKDFIDESLFCLTFDMDKQAGHDFLFGRRPSSELVLFPELSEAVCLQPLAQFCGIQSRKLSASINTVGH